MAAHHIVISKVNHSYQEHSTTISTRTSALSTFRGFEMQGKGHDALGVGKYIWQKSVKLEGGNLSLGVRNPRVPHHLYDLTLIM